MRTHLFVACTNRKRAHPSPELRLGHTDDTLGGSPLADFVGSWTGRLDSSSAEPLPAQELYKGESWSLVRDLAAERSDVSIWICSAGYGLVGLDAPLKAYSATFATGQPDSVGRVIARSCDSRSCSDWWRLLGEWSGPSSKADPRSVADVLASDPRARFVVALPQSYVEACQFDLETAGQEIAPDRLIISTAQPLVGELARYGVRAPGSLRNYFGGTIGSVPLRLGLQLIRTDNLYVETARECAEQLIDLAGELPRYDRVRDPGGAAIDRFIRVRLRKGVKTSATALLREYRDLGSACEQRRFGDAFRRIKEEVRHG